MNREIPPKEEITSEQQARLDEILKRNSTQGKVNDLVSEVFITKTNQQEIDDLIESLKNKKD